MLERWLDPDHRQIHEKACIVYLSMILTLFLQLFSYRNQMYWIIHWTFSCFNSIIYNYVSYENVTGEWVKGIGDTQSKIFFFMKFLETWLKSSLLRQRNSESATEDDRLNCRSKLIYSRYVHLMWFEQGYNSIITF